jgi:hypothetical protein
MLVRKNFFDPLFSYVPKKFLSPLKNFSPTPPPPPPPPPRSPTIFGKKIKFEHGIIKKKIIDTAKKFEK